MQNHYFGYLIAGLVLLALPGCQDKAGAGPQATAAAGQAVAVPSGPAIPDGAFAPLGTDGASVIVRTSGRAIITAVDGQTAVVSGSAGHSDYDRILLPPGEHAVHVGKIGTEQGLNLDFTGSAGDYFAVLLTYVAGGASYWVPVIVADSPQGTIVADRDGLLVGKSPADAVKFLTAMARRESPPKQAGGTQDAEARAAQAKAKLDEGRKLFQRNEFKAALAAFDEALAAAPAFDVALAMRGVTLARLKQPDAAIKSLDRAIESARSTRGADAEWLHWPYFEIGAILAQAGKHGPALEALGESIRLKPTVMALGTRAGIYFRQAEALAGKNDRDSAEPLFRKAQADAVQAIGLEPKAIGMWTLKAGTHLMLNENEQACRSMRRACDLGDCRIIEQYPQCKPGGS